ncbi:hypothetical protein ANN_10475 [Periplaneta americana]|uniref:Mos1 transposase HTH domain-containing protein n=1 Tax=Periplaneta americana TaxID=6978 RepID=A0ABQ8TS95_PERAM|nr:hypothetical protein ANN_10475 [Periplaneta americana]
MRSVIRFLNARNIKPADIHHQLCEVYGDDAISDGMVRRWVRKFNEGRISVHDEQHTGRPSLINDDLVRAVDEKIHEDRRFTISSLSLNFPQMLRSGSQAGEFYNEGIERLVPRLDKCLNNGGDYVGRTAIQFSLFQNYEMPEFTNRGYLDMIQAAEEILNIEGLLARVPHNWTRRCESCTHADGGHFEQYLKIGRPLHYVIDVYEHRTEVHTCAEVHSILLTNPNAFVTHRLLVYALLTPTEGSCRQKPLEIRSGLSANDDSGYNCSANDRSAFYRYKTASIDYSRICNRKRISEKSRRLEIQYCRRRFLWPSKVNVNICSSEKINTFASAHISQHTGHWSRSDTKKINNIKLEIWSSIKSRMKLAYNGLVSLYCPQFHYYAQLFTGLTQANQRIPNLTGPVASMTSRCSEIRNKTAGRIDGCHGDCRSCCLCYASKILRNFRTAISFKEKIA